MTWLCCAEMSIRKGRNPDIVIPSTKPELVASPYQKSCREKGIESSEEITSTVWGKYAISRDPGGKRIRNLLNDCFQYFR